LFIVALDHLTPRDTKSRCGKYASSRSRPISPGALGFTKEKISIKLIFFQNSYPGALGITYQNSPKIPAVLSSKFEFEIWNKIEK